SISAGRARTTRPAACPTLRRTAPSRRRRPGPPPARSSPPWRGRGPRAPPCRGPPPTSGRPSSRPTPRPPPRPPPPPAPPPRPDPLPARPLAPGRPRVRRRLRPRVGDAPQLAAALRAHELHAPHAVLPVDHRLHDRARVLRDERHRARLEVDAVKVERRPRAP